MLVAVAAFRVLRMCVLLLYHIHELLRLCTVVHVAQLADEKVSLCRLIIVALRLYHLPLIILLVERDFVESINLLAAEFGEDLFLIDPVYLGGH